MNRGVHNGIRKPGCSGPCLRHLFMVASSPLHVRRRQRVDGERHPDQCMMCIYAPSTADSVPRAVNCRLIVVPDPDVPDIFFSCLLPRILIPSGSCLE